MKCPVCINKSLKPVVYEGQTIDVCPTCRGIWFDDNELLEVIKSLLSQNKVDEQTFKEAYCGKRISEKTIAQINRVCPKCDIEMDLANYSYNSNIFIDRCSSCGGVWTDEGEMRAAAKYVKGNPEMNQFAESLVHINSACRKTRSKKSRIAALIVSGIYMTLGAMGGGQEGIFHVVRFLFLPLACIFFAEELGDMTGIRFRFSFLCPVITHPSPRGVIVFLGWVYLIAIPVTFTIMWAITG